jgi:hypothetical protein
MEVPPTTPPTRRERMHINDARDFLETTLEGFLLRNFSSHEVEISTIMELNLSLYLGFVTDSTPYWVREKTLALLNSQNAYELQFQGRELKDPRRSLRSIVESARKRIEALAKEGSHPDSVYIRVFLPPPSLPAGH